MSLFLVILYYILQIYAFLMGLSILFSWIPNFYRFKICRLITNISDWYLRPFHGIVVIGFIDFSTIIALTVYQFIISNIYLIII